jgi:hypothetical protein
VDGSYFYIRWRILPSDSSNKVVNEKGKKETKMDLGRKW